MEIMPLLGHPFTILLLTSVGGLFGWIISTLIHQGKRQHDQDGSINLLAKTAADIKELLDITREEMAEIRAEQKQFAQVVHEHNMVKNAGNLLHSHGFTEKKT